MKEKILKYIIIYIILIIGFTILLVLTASFSSGKLYDNVKISSDVLIKEGNRNIVSIPYRKHKIQFDNYIDALMINTAYSIDSSNPMYSVFVARKNYIPNLTTEVYEDSVGELRSSSKYQYHNEVGELRDLINGEKSESFEYARYWHGYLIILRPLLLLFNIKQIRVILTILLAILACVVAFLIYKRTNISTSIIFLTGLLGVEYFYLGFSLQGIFIFIIMMITSLILLLRYEKIKEFGLLFFVTGILTNFFDFLTVPIVTLSVPLILYFLLKKQQENDVKIVLKEIFEFSFIWGIGYILTWATKWLLTDIIFNKNMIYVALSQILYRSISKEPIEEYNIFLVIKENLKVMITPFLISIVSTLFILCIENKINKNIKRYYKNSEEILMDILPYVIILTFPFCWYIILQNHSYYHAFFTYRNLIITNICINIIAEKLFLARLNKKD